MMLVMCWTGERRAAFKKKKSRSFKSLMFLLTAIQCVPFLTCGGHVHSVITSVLCCPHLPTSPEFSGSTWQTWWLSDPPWCHDKGSNALQSSVWPPNLILRSIPFSHQNSLCEKKCTFLFLSCYFTASTVMSKQWAHTVKRSTSVLRTRLVLPACKAKSIIVRPIQTQSTSTIPSISPHPQPLPPTSNVTSFGPLQKPFKKVRSWEHTDAVSLYSLPLLH